MAKTDKAGKRLWLTPIVDVWSDIGAIGRQRSITVEERRAEVRQGRAQWYIHNAREEELDIGQPVDVYYTLPFFTRV